MTPHDIAKEFPILNKMAFFNHAGVAPISHRVTRAIRNYAHQATTQAYVGSGWYARAKQVKALGARLINARGPDEIAFIPNTSTGISFVAKGLRWRPGDSVVITNVEYPANRYPWEDLRRFGVELIEVKQQRDGRIDVDEVCDAIRNTTRVVSLSHVQYASGFRIDLKPVSDMVHKAGGYLCVDAIQSVGVLPVDVQAMGIDFLAADGHKWLLAPEGCGIFYCREDLCEELHPNVIGWMNMVNASDYGNYQFEFQPDARRFEPGSYNIPGIVGMGGAFELLLDVGIDNVWASVEALTARLRDGLASKDYRVFSPRGPSERSGIVVFERPDPKTRPTPENSKIVELLEAQGIIIVMREGRLRASPHFYNTLHQIDSLIAALP